MRQESKLKKTLYRLANSLISDSLYTRLKFKRNLHRWPDLKNPKTFNEKLCYLKLHHRDPIMSTMVDKADAKEYVARIIGDAYIIPTYGIWDNADSIDFAALPARFVMKGTHDSGRVVVCCDKANLNESDAREQMRKSLKRDFYAITREWPYKNVPHRIIAERFIQQADGGLTDYKFFCFNGHVDSVMVCLDRHIGEPKFYFFDKNWNFLRLNKRGLAAPEGFTLPKPDGIEKMFEIASILSKGQPFVRVDLYNVDGKIYFGELTFYPDGGVDANILRSTDEYWGSLLKIESVCL
ncbi:MAG: glycosyl transferase [Muribaculaceae bacterium]|nr:glycosyl transferase [Muribaculaceae bacterium]